MVRIIRLILIKCRKCRVNDGKRYHISYTPYEGFCRILLGSIRKTLLFPVDFDKLQDIVVSM